jgi:hypothetical protein
MHLIVLPFFLPTQIETHVISSITHVAHEYDDDNEPWPIQIEDHDGNLHSVVLEPGQVIVNVLFADNFYTCLCNFLFMIFSMTL